MEHKDDDAENSFSLHEESTFAWSAPLTWRRRLQTLLCSGRRVRYRFCCQTRIWFLESKNSNSMRDGASPAIRIFCRTCQPHDVVLCWGFRLTKRSAWETDWVNSYWPRSATCIFRSRFILLYSWYSANVLWCERKPLSPLGQSFTVFMLTIHIVIIFISCYLNLIRRTSLWLSRSTPTHQVTREL
jgi:hypothetical protein